MNYYLSTEKVYSQDNYVSLEMSAHETGNKTEAKLVAL